jgi:hypothetical protein
MAYVLRGTQRCTSILERKLSMCGQDIQTYNHTQLHPLSNRTYTYYLVHTYVA